MVRTAAVVAVVVVVAVACFGAGSAHAKPSGIEIKRVDAAAGVVAYRRQMWHSPSAGETGPITTELVVLRSDGKEDVTVLCTTKEGAEKKCAPSAASLATEKKKLDALGPDAAVVADFDVSDADIRSKPTADKKVGDRVVHSWAMLEDEEEAEGGFGAGLVFVDVDGERRFAARASWVRAMGGAPTAFAQLRCTDARCVFVGGGFDETGRGLEQSVVVTAPFTLDGKKLDLAAACAKKPSVSVVANAGLLASEAERWTASLTKAGCKTAKPEKAKAERAQSAVYATDVGDPAAAAIAAQLGTAVEKLTWKANGSVVVALGTATPATSAPAPRP